MSEILCRRLRTNHAFSPGEEIMLALGLAAADVGTLPDRVFHAHELTRSQYNVLRMLRGAGARGLLHGEITERLVVGVPDVTRMMDRLVKHGLVGRERSHSDRRRVLHRITDEGEEVLEQIEPELARFHHWLAAALEPEVARSLVASCERLIDVAATDSPWEDSA